MEIENSKIQRIECRHSKPKKLPMTLILIHFINYKYSYLMQLFLTQSKYLIYFLNPVNIRIKADSFLYLYLAVNANLDAMTIVTLRSSLNRPFRISGCCFFLSFMVFSSPTPIQYNLTMFLIDEKFILAWICSVFSKNLNRGFSLSSSISSSPSPKIYSNTNRF